MMSKLETSIAELLVDKHHLSHTAATAIVKDYMVNGVRSPYFADVHPIAWEVFVALARDTFQLISENMQSAWTSIRPILGAIDVE